MNKLLYKSYTWRCEYIDFYIASLGYHQTTFQMNNCLLPNLLTYLIYLVLITTGKATIIKAIQAQFVIAFVNARQEVLMIWGIFLPFIAISPSLLNHVCNQHKAVERLMAKIPSVHFQLHAQLQLPEENDQVCTTTYIDVVWTTVMMLLNLRL